MGMHYFYKAHLLPITKKQTWLLGYTFVVSTGVSSLKIVVLELLIVKSGYMSFTRRSLMTHLLLTIS